MQYRQEIDGLRSLAVLPVILFHAGVTFFSGGYVGVDIFFVISGYLITRIILSELQLGQFSIANFYERRARRILPALYLVALTCIPFAWAWMTPAQLSDFFFSLAAVSTFSSNILFWIESGYFAPASELMPLLHTWSLAVEEQYYVLFPLLLIVAWRCGRRWLFYLLLVIGSGSLMLSQWGAIHHPSANFYLLPTRLWELLLGSLLAFHSTKPAPVPGHRGHPSMLNQCLGAFGLGLILYAIFYFDDQTPFPSLYTLVPTLGTALILLFASGDTLVGKLLSRKLLVGIGLISYSAYLWHQPLFAFARIRSIEEPGPSLLSLLGLTSLALAFLSWRYVEQPFRDRKKFSRRKLFSIAGIATAAIITTGMLGYQHNGFPERTMATGDTYAKADLDHRVRVNHGFSERCDRRFTLHEDCRNSDQPDIVVWGGFLRHASGTRYTRLI